MTTPASRPSYHRVAIALGANLADPEGAIRLGAAAVIAALELRSPLLSSHHLTAPAEGASGPPFVNAVLVGETALDALDTLEALQQVEAAFGRDRGDEGHHGARPLDLDLLDWGGARVDHARLQLPHPRSHGRAFVLEPFAEVAGDWACACCGQTVAALARALRAPARVQAPRHRAAVVLMAVLALAGCEHAAAPVTAWQPVEAQAHGLALHAVPLSTPGATAALADALAMVEGDAASPVLMLKLCGQLDDATLRGESGARELATMAMVRLVGSGGLSRHFELLRGTVDRLYRLAPEANETRFALAYLRWILVSDGVGGVGAGPHDRDVLRELEVQLAALSALGEAFVGPDGHDAAWVRRTQVALAAHRRAEAVNAPTAATEVSDLPLAASPTQAAP